MTAKPKQSDSQLGNNSGHVIVVGRSPQKMHQALEVLRSAGFTTTGTFSRDETLAAISAQEEIFAVVAGGSVDEQLEAELRAAASPKGAHIVRANIGHDDPARHFEQRVVPQLRRLPDA